MGRRSEKVAESAGQKSPATNSRAAAAARSSAGKDAASARARGSNKKRRLQEKDDKSSRDEEGVDKGGEEASPMVKNDSEKKPRKAKVMWTTTEDNALVRGLAKHQPKDTKGQKRTERRFQWNKILDDEDFKGIFHSSRTNVNLKDRWRNINHKSGLLDEIKKRIASEGDDVSSAIDSLPSPKKTSARRFSPEDVELFKLASVAHGGATAEEHLQIANKAFCQKVRDDPRFKDAWWAQHDSTIKGLWKSLKNAGKKKPVVPIERKRKRAASARSSKSAAAASASAAASSSSRSDDYSIPLKFVTDDGAETGLCETDARNSTTVEELQAYVVSQVSIDSGVPFLVYNGAVLNPDKKLEDFDLSFTEKNVIQVVMPQL